MPNRFNKTTVNFWVDTFLLCTFLALVWSSVVVRYVFPPATVVAGWTLGGLDYLAWTDIQFVLLCILAGGIVLHVMLHWSWVCGVIEKWRRQRRGAEAGTQQETGSRTLWGVGMLIVILNVLGLGIAVAALNIQGPVS